MNEPLGFFAHRRVSGKIARAARKELGYSRLELARRLRELPSDEPFCGGGKCPINRMFNLGCNSKPNLLDRPLMKAIDDLPTGWCELTPKQVLALIDHLNAAGVSEDFLDRR